MNRRDFLAIAGGVSATSILGASPLLAAEQITPFYIRGLAMLSLNDPDYLRIGLPEAPHHRATLSVVPKADDRYAVAIRGNGELAGIRAAGGNPDLYLRDVVHVRELYKDAISLIDRSPSMISIPWTAIKSVETHSLSKERWTFVRRETDEEVISFRPRKIADSIKIELLSTEYSHDERWGESRCLLTKRARCGRISCPRATRWVISRITSSTTCRTCKLRRRLRLNRRKLGERLPRQAQVPAMGNSFAPMVVCHGHVCFLMILA